MTQALLVGIALQAVAFIALAFYTNHWFSKFMVVAYLTVLANGVYFALDGVKGWPAEEPKAIKGHLASVVMVNPTPNDRGGIYIGIFVNMPKPWYAYDYPRLAPKTFYVEYSNSRAAQFQKAKKALEDGKEVIINGIPPKESGAEGGESYDGQTTDFMQIIGALAKQLMAKQKDTYKPPSSGLDIEIKDQELPLKE